jgi:phage replication O-like protein O
MHPPSAGIHPSAPTQGRRFLVKGAFMPSSGTFDRAQVTPDLLQAGSITYKLAGAMTRLVLSRAITARLNGTEWRVLAAVITLTGTYSKPYDRTYVAQIAELAQLDKTDPALKRTKRTLRSLARRNLITYDPSQRDGQKSLIGLGDPALGSATCAKEVVAA